jgi:integrase
MSRRPKGPRLYLDTNRNQWVIRDGKNFIRTSCDRSDHSNAEKRLGVYIGSKYTPAPCAAPLIADVLLVYAKEHLPTTLASANSAFNINNLIHFWGAKKLVDVTPQNCRAYTATKNPGGARRDLETLRAAINYWHRFYGPLSVVPFVILPPKSEPKERWLTRTEAKRLRHAAMGAPHLYRFIVIALATGSRLESILSLEWSWIDLDRGIMLRKSQGARQSKKRKPPVRLGRAMIRLLRLWKRQDRGMTKTVCHFNGKAVLKVRRSWAAAVKKAGLGKDVTPHTLRHTRATWLLQSGIDLWEAAGHLGMSVETLQRVYGKHHPDYQKKAAEV